MKDLGELHYCLGLEFWRDVGHCYSRKVCQAIAEKF